MQNLRNAVHRISPAQLLASRTSLNAENKRRSVAKSNSTINDEDSISIQMPDIPSRLSMYQSLSCIRRGLVVRISAFHAGGPGSIPGVGIRFFSPSDEYDASPNTLILTRIQMKANFDVRINNRCVFVLDKRHIAHRFCSKS